MIMSDMYIVWLHCNLKQIRVALQPNNPVHEVNMVHDESAKMILSVAGTPCLSGQIELSTIRVTVGVLMCNHIDAGYILVGHAHGCQMECILIQVLN